MTAANTEKSSKNSFKTLKMKIELDHKAANEMKLHAEATYPFECCGFFFGDDAGSRTISHVLRVDNSKEGDRRRRFEIAPEDYRRAESYAEEQNLDLLGVYHSHPDHPAVPSEHDRSVALPFFSYIIISVQDGTAKTLRSWQLNEDRKFEETLEITEIEIQNQIDQ